MTDDILDRVAKERRERGRRLLVASTDLDNGRVVIWDLSSIAASTRADRRTLYVNALMASSAIPGFFEPVMISPEPDAPDQRTQLHVDGSLSTSVFIPSSTDVERKMPLKVYALINSQMLEEPGDDVIPIGAMDILGASLKMVMRTVLQQSVYSTFLATSLAGGEFYVLGIPEDVKFKVPQYEFSAELSKELYAMGFALGQKNAWTKEPPRFDSLTTQINLSTIRKKIKK